MDSFRKLFIRQFVLLYLLSSFINLSIDPPDLLINLDQDILLEENLSLNEMESVSEFVLEEIFQLTNAVPEEEEADSYSIFKKLEYSVLVELKHITIYYDEINFVGQNTRYIEVDYKVTRCPPAPPPPLWYS